MQRDVQIRKSLGAERAVQRILRDCTAVHGKEYCLSIRSIPKRHGVRKPALDAPSAVIVGAGAFPVILAATLESV